MHAKPVIVSLFGESVDESFQSSRGMSAGARFCIYSVDWTDQLEQLTILVLYCGFDMSTVQKKKNLSSHVASSSHWPSRAYYISCTVFLSLQCQLSEGNRTTASQNTNFVVESIPFQAALRPAYNKPKVPSLTQTPCDARASPAERSRD